jgi:hypothetical protein
VPSSRGLKLMVPKQALRGSALIIQVDDASMDFGNDSGVVGRLAFQKRNLLTIDLKV